MTRFHFTYSWFKHLHFAHLNFNLLPTSPSDARKTHFYTKLEHNTDQKHEPTLLFLTSPRNMKIPINTTFSIWYCNSATSVNLDEQRVIRGTKILVRNQSLFGFLLWACGCFIVFWVISQWSMLYVMEWEYWLCLLMFMKNVTTCSLNLCLFMGILSVVVIVSHSKLKFLLSLNFSVCICYLVKQKQKQSRKCGPSVCCILKVKQKHASVYSFVVYNSLIVNCIRIKW